MQQAIAPVGEARSDFAIFSALARRFGCEIVSMDSAQVYRGMDIGTAKPSTEERRDVRHHLIDLLDPARPEPGGDVTLWSATQVPPAAAQTIPPVPETEPPALGRVTVTVYCLAVKVAETVRSAEMAVIVQTFATALGQLVHELNA